MATLHLNNVTKTFGTVEVLKRIDLDIADGEFVVFVGPSGCGKSTLLRMIAGLEEITGGDLFIDDERCNEKAPKDRGIAMVFQSYALYPHRTVYGNMAFGLRLAGHSRAEIDAKIKEAAGILRMEHLLDRRPSQLSGGQRQRVAIGRAIVRNPRVFLFDEPLSNLDAALRVSMRRELAKLHGQLRATMIYVTHDQVEAMTLADRIVVLDGGVAQQIGPPLELYNNPANLFVAGFIGSPRMNFLEGAIARGDDGETRVRTADAGAFAMPSIESAGAVEGAAVTVGVRPEHMTVSGGSGPLIEGRVALTEQLGDQVLMEIATAGGNTLIARTAPADVLPTGSRATLTFDPADAHLFDENGRAFVRR